MQLVKQKIVLNYLKRNKLLLTIILVTIIASLFYLFLKCEKYLELRCVIILTLFLIFCCLVCIIIYKYSTTIRIEKDKYIKDINKLNKEFDKKFKKMKKRYLLQVNNNQKYAEFGKISGELFHEIANPLTSLNLNIENLKNQITYIPELKQFEKNLEHATLTAKRIAEIMTVIKRQLSNNNKKEYFSLNKEIENAINVLKVNSLKKRVMLNFYANENIKIYGSNVNFYRICLNIINNAIDAYPNFNPWFNFKQKNRIVDITLMKKNNIEILFKDYGKGIKDKNIGKIFDPFFSTKKPGKGTGIGLHVCKRLIQNDFNGDIIVYSKYGQGTLFKIII